MHTRCALLPVTEFALFKRTINTTKMSPLLHTRAPYLPPSHPDGGGIYNRKKIFFRHPGYDDNSNIIMTLPALDHTDGGIHHETARIACAIVANNQLAHGFFTETRIGPRIAAGPDDVLRANEYYFRVSDNPDGQIPLQCLHPRCSLLQTSILSCRPLPTGAFRTVISRHRGTAQPPPSHRRRPTAGRDQAI